ncbi:MAG: caspase family protein, partial [Pseudomonadota bacterium]
KWLSENSDKNFLGSGSMMRLICLCFTFFSVIVTMPTQAQERVALVVGNSKYHHATHLRNPRRDAEAMSDKLQHLGFDVIETFDADDRAFRRAATKFTKKLATADTALLYFAGHGIQLFDKNYLIPVDFDPNRIETKRDLGIDLSGLIRSIEASGVTKQIVIIDACRDNPFDKKQTARLMQQSAQALGRIGEKSGAGLSRGLARLTDSANGQKTESVYIFAAQAGAVAFDGNSGHSPFVEGLLHSLGRTDLDILSMFIETSSYVVKRTNGKQRPEVRFSWTGRHYFSQKEADLEALTYFFYSDQSRREYERNKRAVNELHSTKNSDVESIQFELYASARYDRESFTLKEKLEKTGRPSFFANTKLPFGFRMSYDFDRDGETETLTLSVSNADGLTARMQDNGTTVFFDKCLPTSPAHELDSLDVGLLDINGNRRPDIWIMSRPQGGFWGNLCILEYNGNIRATSAGFGTAAQRVDDTIVEKLIESSMGWRVQALPGNAIEICGGTGCANQWVFKWNGRQFEEYEAGKLVKRYTSLDDQTLPRTRSGQPSDETSQRPELRTQVIQFLDSRFFGHGRADHEVSATIYADKVRYYDRGLISRKRVMADKQRYYRRWPSHSVSRHGDSIKIEQKGTPRDYSVKVGFKYRVARKAKTASGTGTLELTLRRAGDRFIILSETSRVDRRN